MSRIRLCLFGVLGFILMCLSPVYVFAAETTEAAKEYKVIIIDRANLLTDDEEKQLASEMKEIAKYGNMVFITVKLKKGVQYEKFAEDTYYKLCGNEPGALFQIDMGNRKLTLSTSTGLDKLLSSERDTIVDNIYQMATKKQYYACASECFREIKAVLNNEEIAHDMKYITNGIFALTLALIINFIVVFFTTRKNVSKKDLLDGIDDTGEFTVLTVVEGKRTRTYSPARSSGGSSGGGFSGGGGGGGGFSGGSSSHGF